MPAFATGIMRGRFASDGALYTCGMFAWAENATAPGGFHRIRRNEKSARGTRTVTFSDPVEPAECAMKVWSLQRTANYGSKRYDERTLTIRSIQTSSDQCTLTIEMPELAPTQCYELKIGGRVLHGTIHQLSEK